MALGDKKPVWIFFIFRVLVRRARKIAQEYYLMYKEHIPTAQLVQRLASVMQEYTQSGYVNLIFFIHYYYCRFLMDSIRLNFNT